MTWRPEGWGKTYGGDGYKYGGWSPPDEITRHYTKLIFEAGADAMLKALQKEGKDERISK